MTEIMQAIDEWMTDRYAGIYQTKFFGFCELAKRTNETTAQPIPLTITGTHKREQVSLDDRFQLVTWMRIPGTVRREDDPDWDFGVVHSRKQIAGLRFVIAHKVALGEDLIFDIADSVPDLFEIPGYEIAFVDDGGVIDFDHETIYNTELGAGQYEKHRTAWNLYVLHLDISFIKCIGADARISEDNKVRVIE
jgi:hypothetical protein